MPRLHLPRMRVAAIWVAALLGLALAGAALFVWSGIYNVAASSGHFAITTWLLETTLRQSVRTRSAFIESPDLDNPDMIRLGAGHFAGSCAPCHGAPGTPRNHIVRNMLPQPPPLAEAVPGWSDENLFWIVKHGFKFTGMPGWAAKDRDDEVWAVVAFLRKLPDMKAERYRALAGSDAASREAGVQDMVRTGAPRLALTACARCHGDSREAPGSRLVPRLAGQSQTYLARALEEYARGTRRSGVMQSVASALEDAEMRSLASYYAKLPPHGGTGPHAPSAEQIQRGEVIATKGIPERGVPACLACHSGRASGTFPMLFGQSAPYLAQQLNLFRDGLRDQTTHGAIMTVIARRLAERDIMDAASYFESLAPNAVNSEPP